MRLRRNVSSGDWLMQTYDTHPREGEAQPAEKVFMFEFSCLARKYELYFININTLLKTENSKINFQKGVKVVV